MRLKEQAVLQKSIWLLPGCSGEGAGVLDSIEGKLEGTPQCVAWKYQTMTTRGLIAKRNPMSLLVTDSQLPEHRAVITIQNWGANLCIAWLLLAAPGVVQSLARVSLTSRHQQSRVDDTLDPFDQIELHCLSTTTFNATKAALDDLAREREIDAKQTSGFDDLVNAS